MGFKVVIEGHVNGLMQYVWVLRNILRCCCYCCGFLSKFWDLVINLVAIVVGFNDIFETLLLFSWALR